MAWFGFTNLGERHFRHSFFSATRRLKDWRLAPQPPHWK